MIEKSKHAVLQELQLNILQYESTKQIFKIEEQNQYIDILQTRGMIYKDCVIKSSFEIMKNLTAQMEELNIQVDALRQKLQSPWRRLFRKSKLKKHLAQNNRRWMALDKAVIMLQQQIDHTV